MLYRRIAALFVGIAPVLVAAGCVSDDSRQTDDTTEAADTTPISVTIPPVRGTPFCTAMIELTDTILGDQEVDAKALIIETYRSIEGEVPAEIADDFTSVLTQLETGVTAPTLAPVTQPDVERPAPATAPPDATDVTDGTASGGTDDTVIGADPDGSTEFYFGGSTPAERVNDYVAFACRDSENNPGPPATPPLEGEPEDG